MQQKCSARYTVSESEFVQWSTEGHVRPFTSRALMLFVAQGVFIA